jgi:hypothetical protein
MTIYARYITRPSHSSKENHNTPTDNPHEHHTQDPRLFRCELSKKPDSLLLLLDFPHCHIRKNNNCVVSVRMHETLATFWTQLA